MAEIFLSILAMSLAGGACATALAALRRCCGSRCRSTVWYVLQIIPLIFFLLPAALWGRILPQERTPIEEVRTLLHAPQDAAQLSPAGEEAPAADTAAQRGYRFSLHTLLEIAGWSYLCGALLYAGRELWRAARISRRLRRNAVCRGRISGGPRVYESGLIHSPLLKGGCRKGIYLPAFPLSPEQTAAVLSHEMIHYRRHDLAVKKVLFLVRALHFYSPLAHLYVRQTEELMERSCDARAVRHFSAEQRRSYCLALLWVTERCAAEPALCGAALSEGTRLMKRRLTEIMTIEKSKKRGICLAVVGAVLIGLCTAGAVAALSPAAEPEAAGGFAAERMPEVGAAAERDGAEIPSGALHSPLAGPLTVTAEHKMQTEADAPVPVRIHEGVDFASENGASVLAAASGTVTAAGWNGERGYEVVIAHEDGAESAYAHCSKLLVARGDTVRAGDAIAEVGSTGNSTGPHLHFEYRVDGRAVDPEIYLTVE